MGSFLVPQRDLSGKSFSVAVPSSKSMANRALVLAAQTRGIYNLKGDFAAEDIQLMISALQQLGIEVQETAEGLHIQNDLSWMQDDTPLELYLGNSGTSVRFLTSLALLRKGETLLTGKQRMKERPIADLVDSLRQLGAQIDYKEKEGFPPLTISGFRSGGKCELTMRGDVSSQFLTSVLLVSPSLSKPLTISIDGPLISRPYIDITISLLERWGTSAEWRNDQTIVVKPFLFSGFDYEVEGDASAATYWWALAKLHGCDVDVVNVPVGSVQGDVRFLQVLEQLGDGLHGIDIDMNDLPDASLTLMAMAPLLQSQTRISNIASLRVKETDRIDAMAAELRKLGTEIETGEDWMVIHPLTKEQQEQLSVGPPIKIETYDDHRIAMSMAILGTRLGCLEIQDPDCVNKTYPKFWEDLQRFQ